MNFVFVAAAILAVAAAISLIFTALPKEQEAFLEEKDAGGKTDKSITLTVNIDGEDVQMDMYEYLVGVVSCEMPASYDIEALKAQAMAARTYTAYKMEYLPCDKSEDAQICTDPSHCQAFADDETLRQRWGDDYELYINKIRDAVRETDGMVITYDGRLIEAVYSASCGGMTEDSENVFGNALPYLKSVESADADEASKVYTFTIEDYVEKLTAYYADLRINTADAKEKTKKPVRYESGRVEYVEVANAKISGGTMRRIFSLPSTMFTLIFNGNNVEFECRGYGHGVGMSQVGANGYTKQGMTAEEIIKHYYTGVEIEKIKK